jgi:formate hydrogenlyase subunit 3/multisubunit Na+/H+ antiporter MnhD subunit
MNNAIAFHSNNRKRIAARLIYLFIGLLCVVVLIHAINLLYAGAEKFAAYVNDGLASTNAKLNYCTREYLKR